MTWDQSVDPMLADALKRSGLDTVEGAFAFGGGEDLTKPGLGLRRRTRLVLMDEGGRTHQLYLKRYGGGGLWRRLRRFLTRGRTESPAGIEFRNIRAARDAGVPTMAALVWGEQLDALGHRRSYLVVTAVGGEALERCAEGFLERCADQAGKVNELTGKLATAAANLHRAGYAHRDFYASHVFLHESADGLGVYVIDLARMFAPRRRKFRWRVKDLAQLKYSMPPEWVENYWDAFVAGYLERCDAGPARRLNRAIDRKAAAMRRREARKSNVLSRGE